MSSQRTLSLIAVLIAAAAVLPARADAQSDILLQLRSGSPSSDRFRVDSAGGFVSLGSIGFGIIPTSGSGYRFMWHPFKSALRAGGIEGNEWDDANIGFFSWAGGYSTRALGNYSIATGNFSLADAPYSIAMGNGNNVRTVATGGVALGQQNHVFRPGGVAIGWEAVSGTATTGDGTVAIGRVVTAEGDRSLALGYRASTGAFTGAVAIGDGSTGSGSQVLPTANHQFTVRAAGGYRLYTNATLTSGAVITPGGSSWTIVSDRGMKELFQPVDGEDVLRRLRAVPVTSWNYLSEGRDVRHIGPVAQDWHAAFPLNGDSLRINTGDLHGVSLAAIRALDERTRRIDALEADLAEARQAIAELTAALRRLEALEAERGGRR